jgi:photosystem II stability/assembly factor-like uncharacterized protein
MKKIILAYATLTGLVAAMIVTLAISAHHPSLDREAAAHRGRPRSIRERMLEERQSTARTALLSEERTNRGDDDANEGAARDAFDKWFYDQRKYPGNSLPPGAVSKANRHADDKNFDERDENAGPKWTAIGPGTIPDGQTDGSAGQLSPVSGRVSAIATDPSNPDIAYVAGAQGGVWKTTNALSHKPSWEPLTDHEASLAVGAIAVDPVNPDIIYVGTGEANRSCDSYYGQGILRSLDGGRHWTLLGGGGDTFGNPGPFVGKAVSKILIDPATAGSATGTTLWAATTFGFYESGTIATCDTPNGLGPVGLWRSTDSGQTWQLQNVPAGSGGTFSVQDAAIDPTTGDIVYAAVRSTGVFMSVNAKAATASYAPVTTGFPAGSNVSPLRRIDIGIGGPNAPNTLYAAIENGASGDRLWGLFKTTDGGAHWSNIDAGFNGTASFVNVDIDPGPGVSGPAFVTDLSWNRRRLLVTLTGSTRAVLSRTVLHVVDGDHLLLTTTTGFAGAATANYSVGNYPSYCDGQCFYDMTIAVDPADSSGGRIYVGGNPAVFFPNHAPSLDELTCSSSHGCSSHFNWRSDDAGLTWSSISQGDGAGGSLHTDDHAYAFGIDGSLYDGNDGGIWRSGDRGLSWTSLNTNIAITQFQGVALDPSSKVVLGGTQDNGTNLRSVKLASPPSWFHSDFGDGGMAVIDQSTPARMFHTYFNQAFNFMGPARSDVGGIGGPGSWPFVGAYFGYGPQYYNGMDPTDPVSFYAPLTQHPAFTPNVIYFGSNRVYRSPDPKPFIFTNPPTTAQPKSWTAVSPVLTKPIVPVPPSTSTVSNAYLSWIGVSPALLNGKEVVFAGASDGRVSVSSTVDGSRVSSWSAIDKAPLPNRAVTQVLPVASDPTANTVYVTFSGFSDATPGTPGHVFVSTNGIGAATWTDISGDLPDIPVNAIAVDEGKGKGQLLTALYVGTDVGVFESLDGGVHWRRLSRGMPNVAVFGLAIDSDGHLVAATHGRGMFELSKSNGQGPK